MASQASPGRPSSAELVSALERPGWLTFSAVVLMAVAVTRVISAIYYFADSNRVNNLTFGIFGGHLFVWGIWDLLIAVLAFWAGWSLLSGQMFGRVIGYFWAGFTLIQSFTIFSFAPWYAGASLAVAVLVIYALSATSGWKRDDSFTG
jgi:hypothetical protein